MDYRRDLILLGLSLTTPISLTVKAEVYFSEAEVVKSIFPGLKFKDKWVELTDGQIKDIENKSGERVRDKKIKIWKSSDGSFVFIDRVIGKHDFITYAVGIAKGAVKQIEVMEYRETYGHEVRGSQWREQFVGKTSQSVLKVNKDIKNISGATLSSAHLTAGVRRILQTYEVLKSNT